MITIYDVEGTKIKHTKTGDWNVVEAIDDPTCIKSFGKIKREHSLFGEEEIEVNKGLSLEDVIRIVAGKAKDEYYGKIKNYNIKVVE